jgi:hypothetical protein
MNRPTEGAGIKCHVCGARPFATAWGLDPALDCFDLIKVGDLWGCPKHRVRKVKPVSKEVEEDEEEAKELLEAREAGIEETLLDELADIIGDMGVQVTGKTVGINERQRTAALDLINRIRESAAA